MKIIYIGGFPPPYGGVTIKNKMFYDNLSSILPMQKVDLILAKKKNIKELAKLVWAVIRPRSILIIGSSGSSRKKISKLLYYFNRSSLNRSLLMVMGGIESVIISNDIEYIKYVKEYKQVYVQTEGMKKHLVDVGINNVTVFPTCREFRDDFPEVRIKEREEPLKCVFFSLVSKDKGADLVLLASDLLRNSGIDVEIDMYGHIEDSYSEEFQEKINNSKVNYKGVFKPDIDNVYNKLNEYDLLLFPTRWKAEGTPGILIESKIAGIAAITSDQNFNSEIVANGIEGIILNSNNEQDLADAITELYKNEKLLNSMKYKAKDSSKKYMLEGYIEDIVQILKDSMNK